MPLYGQEWSTLNLTFFIPPRNGGGFIFTLQFVSVCVCVSVKAGYTHRDIQGDRQTDTQRHTDGQIKFGGATVYQTVTLN